MEEEIKSLYIKRSQKDYPRSFKMSVVREVESGGIGICDVAHTKEGTTYTVSVNIESR